MMSELDASAPAAVLLVERDANAARSIRAFLADRGHDVEWVDDGEKAFNRLDSRVYDVLIAELHMHRVDGMRLLTVARERNPEMCVILLVEPSDVELATEAMRRGAADFQVKPPNPGKLDAVIQQGLGHQRLVLQQHELRRRLDEQYGLRSLVGHSRAMVRVYEAVRQAARTTLPVLIVGEAGTGKDLIAQTIHSNSPRRDEVFAVVQCDAQPSERVTIELFGAAGNRAQGGSPKPGRVELADNGTVYLNEVGALTPEQQALLLHFLEKHRFHRVDGDRPITVDTRVIAAASAPLEAQRFTPDLADLLGAITIEVPPLRERREDIPLLVQHFARQASQDSGQMPVAVTPNALDVLTRYDWPGNVRELKNIVEGIVLAARGQRQLDVSDVPAHVRGAARAETREIRIPIGTTMHDVERMVIEETLKAEGYHKERCAKTLGIGLRTLYRKIREYDLR